MKIRWDSRAFFRTFVLFCLTVPTRQEGFSWNIWIFFLFNMPTHQQGFSWNVGTIFVWHAHPLAGIFLEGEVTGEVYWLKEKEGKNQQHFFPNSMISVETNHIPTKNLIFYSQASKLVPLLHPISVTLIFLCDEGEAYRLYHTCIYIIPTYLCTYIYI